MASTVMGTNNRHAPVGALLALVLAGPFEMVAGGQLHVVLHSADGFFHRGAEVAPAHRVFDGDVALPAFRG